MEKLSCAITGENPQRFKFKYNEEAPLCKKIKTALTELIENLYEKGVRTFIIGCSVGVDTWAAEIIIELKQQPKFSEIELSCAIPFPEHTEKFTAGQKKRYGSILAHSDYNEIVNRHYSPVAYKRLNYYLVDKSQYLIAVYDPGKSESRGLGQTVNYAIKNKRAISFINPDTAIVTEYKS
ncbi:MAG: DUF1273 domain-containing protein [Clostridiales bacterium]|jgi:uncharacterized phage-like protein YoqJ|nr:DUF1273 domain-containing protein [Clostridiales bacterium]